MKAVANLHTGATALEFSRRDGFQRNKQIVQPAWAGQASVQADIEQRFGHGELLFCVLDGEKL